MRRREFITFVGGAAAVLPRIAHAQSGRMRRVALLMGNPEGDPRAQVNLTALREGLRKLDWIEGHNIQIDYRLAGGGPERARTFARELIGMAPDVIVCSSNQVTEILLHETSTIPIVFVFVGDPVGSGFVASLERPGGNATGFPNYENAIGGKWLEILHEIAPQIDSAGFIFHPNAPPNVGFFRAAEAASPALAIKVLPLPVHNRNEIENGIIAIAASTSNSGLIVASHALLISSRDLIVGLATDHHMPGVYGDRSFAESGGLLSYGNNTADLFRSGATYVDRILKGEKPQDLPVQLPTKYEMIINLNAAKAIGLTIPASYLLRADEVIE
jgi:putative tryptophan/tyrosine transport system substrate-binding protein